MSLAYQTTGIWKIIEELHKPSTSMTQALDIYANLIEDPGCTDPMISELAAWDRFFLGIAICNRNDLKHPWIYERCREVEHDPDGYLDLWFREAGKSSLITFLGILQEIIRDQDITIGIFSHTRPIAKSFLRQIKMELEQNPKFHAYWPHIFWKNPKKEASIWNEDEGITVKRRSNPKEATVESYGLVDSQPTGKHFRLMVYDDVVTERSVGTPEMILKTTMAWELSRNLSAYDDCSVQKDRRTWYIGTRYNYSDSYGIMLARNAAIPRIYPATDTGTPDGKPIYFSEREWERKKGELSDFTLSCQYLLNPVAGSQQEFKPEWIRLWEIRPEILNVGILVDPANSKKPGSCNTAMAVIGVDHASNKYLLDGACHKMSLEERWKMLSYLYYKWVTQPGIQSVQVGYEKYGMQCDQEHFEIMMRIEQKSFPIYPVSWARDQGGHASSQKKDDRIRRLIPDHKNWRFFYPYEGDETKLMAQTSAKGKGYLCARPILRKNQDGRVYNLVEWYKRNEYLFFPATTAKDFGDAMSRIYDLDIQPPQFLKEEDLNPQYEGEA